jgi:hypothetical protein
LKTRTSNEQNDGENRFSGNRHSNMLHIIIKQALAEKDIIPKCCKLEEISSEPAQVQTPSGTTMALLKIFPRIFTSYCIEKQNDRLVDFIDRYDTSLNECDHRNVINISEKSF